MSRMRSLNLQAAADRTFPPRPVAMKHYLLRESRKSDLARLDKVLALCACHSPSPQPSPARGEGVNLVQVTTYEYARQ